MALKSVSCMPCMVNSFLFLVASKWSLPTVVYAHGLSCYCETAASIGYVSNVKPLNLQTCLPDRQALNDLRFIFASKARHMEFLKSLGIQSTNKGVSTGQQWIDSTGKWSAPSRLSIGKLIGSVTSADKSSFEGVIRNHSRHSTNGGWYLLPSEEK